MFWLVKNYFSLIHFFSCHHITSIATTTLNINSGTSPSCIAVSIRSLPNTYKNSALIASPHMSFIVSPFLKYSNIISELNGVVKNKCEVFIKMHRGTPRGGTRNHAIDVAKSRKNAKNPHKSAVNS